MANGRPRCCASETSSTTRRRKYSGVNSPGHRILHRETMQLRALNAIAACATTVLNRSRSTARGFGALESEQHRTARLGPANTIGNPTSNELLAAPRTTTNAAAHRAGIALENAPPTSEP
jgi:hypothetical protein